MSLRDALRLATMQFVETLRREADAVDRPDPYDARASRFTQPREERVERAGPILEFLVKETRALRAEIAALREVSKKEDAKPVAPPPYEPPYDLRNGPGALGLDAEIAKPPVGTEQRVAKVGELIVILMDAGSVPKYSTGKVGSCYGSYVVADFDSGPGNEPARLGVPHRMYAVVERKFARKLADNETVWDDVDKERRAAGEAVPDPVVSPYGRGVYGDPTKPATDAEVRRAQLRSVGIPDAAMPVEPIAPPN